MWQHMKGNLDIMLKVWEWAEVKLTTEEISNKFLLATGKKGRTVLHVAEYEGEFRYNAESVGVG